MANSALASDATDGGVRTLDQSLASRFGVDGRVGSQAFGGGERAAILLFLCYECLFDTVVLASRAAWPEC